MRKYLATRIIKNIISRSGGRYSFLYNDRLSFVLQNKPNIRCYSAWDFIINNFEYVI